WSPRLSGPGPHQLVRPVRMLQRGCRSRRPAETQRDIPVDDVTASERSRRCRATSQDIRGQASDADCRYHSCPRPTLCVFAEPPIPVPCGLSAAGLDLALRRSFSEVAWLTGLPVLRRAEPGRT